MLTSDKKEQSTWNKEKFLKLAPKKLATSTPFQLQICIIVALNLIICSLYISVFGKWPNFDGSLPFSRVSPISATDSTHVVVKLQIEEML